MSVHRLRSAIALNLRVQARHLFPHIYLGLTVLYALLIRSPLLRPWQGQIVPIMLFSEPGVMGLLFVAAQMYFERSQGSDLATAVTPLRAVETALAKAFAIALLATGAGLLLVGLTLPAREPRTLIAGLAALLPVLLVTSTLFGLVGVALAMRFRDFTRFVFGSQMMMMPVYAPAAAVLGLLEPAWLAWLPSAPLMYAVRHLYAAPSGGLLAGGPWPLVWFALPASAWAVAATVWASRSYLRGGGRSR